MPIVRGLWGRKKRKLHVHEGHVSSKFISISLAIPYKNQGYSFCRVITTIPWRQSKENKVDFILCDQHYTVSPRRDQLRQTCITALCNWWIHEEILHICTHAHIGQSSCLFSFILCSQWTISNKGSGIHSMAKCLYGKHISGMWSSCSRPYSTKGIPGTPIYYIGDVGSCYMC